MIGRFDLPEIERQDENNKLEPLGFVKIRPEKPTTVDESKEYFEKVFESGGMLSVKEINRSGTEENFYNEGVQKIGRGETKESLLKKIDEKVKEAGFDTIDDIKIGKNNHEVINGIRFDSDDKGNVYGVDGKLIPGSSYELNGYKYSVDDKGRIASAEGRLQKKKHKGRYPIKPYDKDVVAGRNMKENDDNGHLIGDQFEGDPGFGNLVPQHSELNGGEVNKLERELRKAVDEGKKVDYKVEPVYKGNSERPVSFRCTYTIDGEENVVTYRNGGIRYYWDKFRDKVKNEIKKE